MMVGFCQAPAVDPGLVRALLGSVDCNIQAASQFGYQAIFGPGSQLALALTALLTIYVAVFGIRLVLGTTALGIGDLTMMVLKIGIILLLATDWPAYQQLVFDSMFHGPEQIAAAMTVAIQPPSSILPYNPFEGLQASYDQLQAASAFFLRLSPPGASPLAGTTFAGLALGLASFMTLLATLGLILTSKLVLGILLALGPIFIACLLFDGTRGVFEGWLRATLSFALVSLFATLLLVLHLSLIQPYLVAVRRTMQPGGLDTTPVTAILILSFIIFAVSLGGVIGALIVMTGFRLPWLGSKGVGAAMVSAIARPAATVRRDSGPSLIASPVGTVSAAAAAMERRERLQAQVETPRRLILGSAVTSATENSNRAQISRRFSKSRRTASMARRDR